MRSTRFWALALAATVVCTMSACSAGPTTDVPKQGTAERMKPLVEQFKDARARARSDFEKAALDRAVTTGKIDPADYEEAFNRYRRCAQDSGLKETYAKLPNGIYRVTPDVESAKAESYPKTMTNCAANAGLMSLEALYRTQVDNPDLLADPSLIVVRCLIKVGLAPADYTTDKLNLFLKSDMSKPGDFDPMDAEAQKCLTAGGVAINLGPDAKGGK
jgi:hypothetical protein